MCSVHREAAEILTLADRAGNGWIPLGATAHVSAWVADTATNWVVVPLDVPVEVPRVVDVNAVSLKSFQLEFCIRLEVAKRACSQKP